MISERQFNDLCRLFEAMGEEVTIEMVNDVLAPPKEEVTVPVVRIVSILTRNPWAASKNEAELMITQGRVKVNDQVIFDEDYKARVGDIVEVDRDRFRILSRTGLEDLSYRGN